MRYLLVKSSPLMEVTTYHPFFAEEMGAPECDGWWTAEADGAVVGCGFLECFFVENSLVLDGD